MQGLQLYSRVSPNYSLLVAAIHLVDRAVYRK